MMNVRLNLGMKSFGSDACLVLCDGLAKFLFTVGQQWVGLNTHTLMTLEHRSAY